MWTHCARYTLHRCHKSSVLECPDDCSILRASFGKLPIEIKLDTGGEVAASIADVGMLETQLPRLLQMHKQDIQRAPLLILDGNMPQQTILVGLCLPVWLRCR